MTFVQKSYESVASMLPDYDRSTRDPAVITRWADRYVELRRAGDKHEADKYFCAITLKFWDNVQRFLDAVRQTGLDYDDCAQHLAKCVQIALDYAAWREDSPHYKKPTTAKACINTVIASRGIPEILYGTNLDSSKANVNRLSLDAALEDGAGEGKTMLDTLSDGRDAELADAGRAAADLVQALVKRKKIVEAIIADVVANRDCVKQVRETVTSLDDEGNEVKRVEIAREFWPYKCVQELGSLTDEYADYFMSRYEVARGELDAALTVIRKANNQKKYKYLAESRATMRSVYLATA